MLLGVHATAVILAVEAVAIELDTTLWEAASGLVFISINHGGRQTQHFVNCMMGGRIRLGALPLDGAKLQVIPEGGKGVRVEVPRMSGVISVAR